MSSTKNFVIVTSVLLICFSYYLYTPLPDGIAEPWKVRGLLATVKTIKLVSKLTDAVGLMGHINMTRTLTDAVMRMSATSKSDPSLEVTDKKFDGVPVRIYKPKSRKTESPALVYFHGGGWTFGNLDYADRLSGYIATAANIIVVSVDYRLAPENPFPIPFNDCVTATLHLIHNAARYGVDDRKVAVAGDSAGGNLAAAVSLKLSLEHQPSQHQPSQDQPSQHQPSEHQPSERQLCFQFLIYPALQAFDFELPSYLIPGQPFLDREMMAFFWTVYAGLPPHTVAQFVRNEHTSPTLKTSKYARYVDPRQLPEKYRKTDQPRKKPDLNFGNVTLSDEVDGIILDQYFAPLMAGDLSKVPQAIVLTAQHDPLRDDGLLYVERLAAAGVDAVNMHAVDGFHIYMTNPDFFQLAEKSTKQFVEYAKERFEKCA